MHLNRLYIRGFRSIQELDLRLSRGKNVIIGRNNAGKSNIVRALDIVLGEASPTYDRSENVTENDFHSSRLVSDDGELIEQKDEEIYIWCELERDTAEDLNYDQIRKCFGYNFHGRRSTSGPAEQFLMDIEPLNERMEEIFEINPDEIRDKVWVDSKLSNQNSFQSHLESKHHFAYAFRARLTEHGVEKELRFLCREKDAIGWSLCFKATVRNELMQSAILPSFRDPASQLRITNWTWFGKLLRHLTRDYKDDPQLKQALLHVQNEGNRIFYGITEVIENDALSVSFPDAKLSIQFHGHSESDLHKNCGIYIDDGFKSPLADKGAGIQSATILGLFSYYTREVSTKSSALLCIEEPELYLHPHARRVISERLDDFIEDGRNQVVVTTHGVEFLRTARTSFNLLLVRKRDGYGTTVKSIASNSFMHMMVDNNQNELFFADKVIICEGLDEHVIRAVSEELFPFELDRQNVSIVAVSGKQNIAKMSEVLSELDIDCFILADFDFLLRDVNKSMYGSRQTPSVEQLPNRFFSQPHVKAKRVNRSNVANLRNTLRNSNEEAFYTAKSASEFDDEKLHGNLTLLRQAGIGILPGEIEHLSLDREWVAPGSKKFDVKKVYELRELLSQGYDVSSLFEVQPIKELLEAVLVIPHVAVESGDGQSSG